MAAKPLREGLSPSNGGLDILMSTYMRLGTDLDFEASKFFVEDTEHGHVAAHSPGAHNASVKARPGAERCGPRCLS